MNRLFVNVKVDREERPDLDKVYQLAHQVLTQRGGGWPLTMFLAPDDLTPFFGGTYFPKQARYGMPAFTDLIERVAAFYRDERDSVRSQNAALRGVFDDLMPPVAKEAHFPESRTHRSGPARILPRASTRDFGGFSPAPKFPHAASIELLLRAWQATAAGLEPDREALAMATLTLRRMAEGGIFDQLGGGFCRYSVDPYWMIPHFEKMLYDNGPLLALCAQAAVATGDAVFRDAARRRPRTGRFARCARRRAAFMPRSTRTPRVTRAAFTSGGGTRSSRSSCPTNIACSRAAYGLDREPNFEGDWHLHAFVGLDRVADELAMPTSQARGPSRFRAREAPVGPRAARPSRPRRQDPDCLERPDDPRPRDRGPASRRAGAGRRGACRHRLPAARIAWRDGSLLASWKHGAARFRGLPRRLRLPARCAARSAAIALSRGGPASSPARSPTRSSNVRRPRARRLLVHGRGRGPAAAPAEGLRGRGDALGNGVAAQALARLGWLTGEMRYLEAAEADDPRRLRPRSCAPRKRTRDARSRSTSTSTRSKSSCMRGAAQELATWQSCARAQLCAAAHGDCDSSGRGGPA